MAGWSDVFGKVFQWLPGRIEKIKNEKKRLIDERKKLMAASPTANSSARVIFIDRRLSEINSILGNKAAD